MRHKLFPAIAFCCATLCMACNGRAQQRIETAAADTFRLDSADFVDSDSATAEVKLHMEYFTGKSPLASSVRRYVREQLEKLNGEELYGIYDPNGMEDQVEKTRKWGGEASDIHGMTAFYGRQMYENLRSESQKLNANVGTEYALRMVEDYELRLFCDAKKFVTFRASGYFYEGGAHGYPYMHAETFVRESGKRLTQVLDTTQTQALQPLLMQGISDYLNSWNEGEGYGEGEAVTPHTVKSYLLMDAMVGVGIEKIDSLADVASDVLVPLPQFTPALTEKGLLFTYNPYEIAPYSVGIITFTIPYEQLRPYLTEEVQRLVDMEEK